MIKLEQMETFYFVATWGSFSRAAIELGVSKGYVSTQISSLEHDLGVKLLQRSTRHLRLTEAGATFLESCTKIVREKQLATTLLNESQVEPLGHLKVSAPPSLCSTLLAELVPLFQRKYPKIFLTIDSSPTAKNLLQHDIDIALRITATPDENYIAHVVSTFEFITCASPSYFNEHGVPHIPDDLRRHNCLIYSADPAQHHWPFQMSGQTKIVSVQGNLISANSAIIKKSVLAGQGIARLPAYVLYKEVANQALIPLFAEQMNIKMPIYALYASSIKTPSKIKIFISFLSEYADVFKTGSQ